MNSDLPSKRESAKNSSGGNFSWPIAAAILLAVAALVPYVANFVLRPLSLQPEEWGQFGDYLGGILNPAIAALALYMLVASVKIQRVELRDTKEALEMQAQSVKKQAFEQTFFQLLSRFDAVREDIRYHGGTTVNGRAAIEGLANAISDMCHQEKYGLTLGGAIKAYGDVYGVARSELGPYFRSLYHVFKRIRDGQLSPADEVTYANIARAGLSNDDLRLIFLNGLTGEGLDGFKPLIEHYGLLKHLDRKTLFKGAPADLRGAYEVAAFQSSDARSIPS